MIYIISWRKGQFNHLIIVSKSFKVKTKKTQDIHGWLIWRVPTCSAEDPRSIPASKKSPGEKNGNPLQYPCLENSMDWGDCVQSWDHYFLLTFKCDNIFELIMVIQFSSAEQLYPTLRIRMKCSTPGFPVHHQLLELAQTHVHRVSDAIQPSHPLSSPSPAFNLSQHQGLFQWVSSSHEVAKALEFQLQHQSFQWIFRTDFF